MLKVLVKKQLFEIFKGYFYDAKKNKMRPKWAVALYFVLFAALMFGLLGGTFGALALSMCPAMTAAGMGWLYFALMGIIGIVLGVIGTVFNAFAMLYLGKDNELLLSLPIPVKTILAARLIIVYVLGVLYSCIVTLPALAIYWVTEGVTASRVVCGVAFFVIITLVVVLLSCLLGWGVARISLKMKHKSFAAVAAALVFIGGYYFFYFKANILLQDIIRHADDYGAKIKGGAYLLYLFGRIGEGDWLWALVFLAAALALTVVAWTVLHRSYLGIATATGRTEKKQYREKTARQKSPFAALLGKELGRFTSSANYMLNCGMGVILIPAVGVAFLIKGRSVMELIEKIPDGGPELTAALFCAALCMLASMNIPATPSVSLEGKSLWIPQSLPVEPKTVLRAKAALQLALTVPPVLFASACAAVTLRGGAAVTALLFVMPVAFAALYAAFCTFIAVKMPLLQWTNELAPIKQGGGSAVVIFGDWLFVAALAGLYLLFGKAMGVAAYLALWTVLFLIGAAVLLRWLDTRGAKAFAAL